MKGFWCETGLIHWRQNDNKWSWVVIDPPQAFIRVTFFQLISTQFILPSKIFNIHWKLKKALLTWKFRSLGSILRQDMKRLSPKLSDCVCPTPVVSSSSFVDRSPLIIFACWKQTSDSIFNISAPPVTQDHRSLRMFSFSWYSYHLFKLQTFFLADLKRFSHLMMILGAHISVFSNVPSESNHI